MHQVAFQTHVVLLLRIKALHSCRVFWVQVPLAGKDQKTASKNQNILQVSLFFELNFSRDFDFLRSATVYRQGL